MVGVLRHCSGHAGWSRGSRVNPGAGQGRAAGVWARVNQSTSALVCIVSCAFTEDFIWTEGFTVKKSLEAMSLHQCAYFPGNDNLMPREGRSPAEATQQVCNTVGDKEPPPAPEPASFPDSLLLVFF